MRFSGSTCAMVTSLGLLGACQEPAHEPQNPPPVASAPAIALPPSPVASSAPSASALPSAVASSAPPPPPGPPAPRTPTPPAEPQGARLAMFIARTLRAPQKPSAADQAALNNILRDSTPSGELDSLIQNSCGARVHSDPIPLRTGGGSGGLEGIGGSETVQVGLTPHPGMTPAEQQQASTAVSAMTSAITRCLSPLARKNPKILGATIRVGAATMGDGTPTRLTILPTGTSDEVKTCVTGAIAPLLIGDTKNAQLLFDVRIDKTPK